MARSARYHYASRAAALSELRLASIATCTTSPLSAYPQSCCYGVPRRLCSQPLTQPMRNPRRRHEPRHSGHHDRCGFSGGGHIRGQTDDSVRGLTTRRSRLDDCRAWPLCGIGDGESQFH